MVRDIRVPRHAAFYADTRGRRELPLVMFIASSVFVTFLVLSHMMAESDMSNQTMETSQTWKVLKIVLLHL